jgi:hypothetical protein
MVSQKTSIIMFPITLINRFEWTIEMAEALKEKRRGISQRKLAKQLEK